ncbi:MAG: hypothetical protein AAF617_18400 [Bacteroidota bacterium]
MKKQQIKSLRLNKKLISNFTQNTIVGGTFISCPGVGICGPNGTSAFPCPPPPPPQTNFCPGSISCDEVGICGR